MNEFTEPQPGDTDYLTDEQVESAWQIFKRDYLPSSAGPAPNGPESEEVK